MNDKCPTGCFWVHDSVVVNSGRAGIRYENRASFGLFANNEIHANSSDTTRGGIDIRDSQNAAVESNVFGGATFRFIDPLNKLVTMTYGPNTNNQRIGVRATDSGRTERVNLLNVIVRNNTMNNELIVAPDDELVVCSNNWGLGTKLQK